MVRGSAALLGNRRDQSRNVEAGHTVERSQQFGSRCAAQSPEQIDQVIHHLFALTDHNGIENRCDRLRVHGDARPAGDEQGPGFVSVLGQWRNPGLPQHLDHVEVIHFVGDGESPHRESGHLPPRLQAEQLPI